MGKSNKIISEFQLEGRFLGFILKSGYKPKMMRLETGSGEYWIKVPKSLRNELVRAELYNQLKPGDRIHTTGESILSLKNGTIKLIADQVQLPNHRYSTERATERQPVTPTPTMPVEGVSVNGTRGAACSQKKKCSILVCQKSDCRKRGGEEIAIALEEQLEELGLSDQVKIKKTGCMSRCKQAPNVVVMPDKTRYSRLNPEEIPQLIEKHFADRVMT
jgi:NADH:ubiquinone oxidoreductase subunit E